MTLDLYAILGIERGASHDEIRAAFRAKAKSAHPDVGGDRAEFERLTLAHDVLTDPERRKRYDETGAFDATAPDNSEAQALEFIAGLFDEVVQTVEAHRQAPSQADLASMMRAALKDKLAEVAKTRIKIAADRAKWEKLSGRFSRKSGTNFMEAMVQRKLAPIERGEKACDQRERLCKRAAELLADVAFDVERLAQIPPAANTSTSFGQAQSGLNAWPFFGGQR